MKLPAQLKSKKVLLILGAGVVIAAGFLVFKFMTSSGIDAEPERNRSASRSEKRIPKPSQNKSDKSPLFETMQALKDPFRDEDRKVVELQDKINTTQKEIEYLKASLEEKRLRQEIKEIEQSLAESEGSTTNGREAPLQSIPGEKRDVRSQKMVVVKAILITDDEKAALLFSDSNKSWVHEGEELDGWEIKEIKKDRVVVLRTGKTYVFFYDRPSSVTIEG
jgi:type IV pilus biogenesis protein PilP